MPSGLVSEVTGFLHLTGFLGLWSWCRASGLAAQTCELFNHGATRESQVRLIFLVFEKCLSIGGYEKSASHPCKLPVSLPLDWIELIRFILISEVL